ncbi:unnamed protein product [Acanthoscelides obtectus]|uniref:Uncharacterized protein n=1 Tax=Acanthoscelides obtectus TaxID=200917 RepID=A0A9P0NUI0_ACAOB|nr:unnamed protein product [Acanthoscelides obtectus]CAK1662024.1 hypothetical protein AOBTE_LOCUS22937 [Acanthoscelides obtectus]
MQPLNLIESENKSTKAFIVPDELPSLLSVVYSNIPTIKKGKLKNRQLFDIGTTLLRPFDKELGSHCLIAEIFIRKAATRICQMLE